VRSQLKDFSPDYAYLFSVAGLIIIFDQVTKFIIRQTIPFGQAWMPLEWLAPYFRFVNWHNRGAAFGMLQGFGGIFGILAIIVSLAIIVYYPVIPRTDKWMRLALALQLAGAMGNLIDRLTVGAVTDFVSIWQFPVFNVADLSITMGVIVLLLPYLPQLPTEWADYQVLQKARQINARLRATPVDGKQKAQKEDDSVSLGILEVMLQDDSPVREYILSQRAKRIRHYYNHHRPLAPGQQRQTQVKVKNRENL
jgi:signal peptidase II